MKIKEWLGYGTLVCVVAGAAWAFADTYGFRPALKAEVDEVRDNVEVVGRSVEWLQLSNYENILKRGGGLSREACAKYRKLAIKLGVPPLRC